MSVFPFLLCCKLFSLLHYVAGAIGQNYNSNWKKKKNPIKTSQNLALWDVICTWEYFMSLEPNLHRFPQHSRSNSAGILLFKNEEKCGCFLVLLCAVLTNILKPQTYLSRKWMGKAFGLCGSKNSLYLHTPWKLYSLKLHPKYKCAHIHSVSCQRD